MKLIVVVLMVVFLIRVGPVVASPLIAPSNVQLDGLIGQTVVEKNTNAVSQTDSQALSEVGHEQPIERDAHTGVAYSVTRSISVGFAYNLEEIEDLSEDHIQPATVSGDYENHTLLVRAHWRFN